MFAEKQLDTFIEWILFWLNVGDSGWQWRLFEWRRKFSVGAERCQFDAAQWRSDGHSWIERQWQKGIARCDRVSCGRFNAWPSAFEWINIDKVNVSTSLRLCDACNWLHSWTHCVANAALHADGGKNEFMKLFLISHLNLNILGFQLNGYSKGSKVRQILADLALSQVANKRVEYLNISENRRLAIGTYEQYHYISRKLTLRFVFSSKRYSVGAWSRDAPTRRAYPGSGTVERIFTDINSVEFGQKDRLRNSAIAGETTFGCLSIFGSSIIPVLGWSRILRRHTCDAWIFPRHWIPVSATGKSVDVLFVFVDSWSQASPIESTSRDDIDWFIILFVFCRSRDRFLESSQQIEALVQRFARETPMPDMPMNPIGSGKVPLSYGKPGEVRVWGMLYLWVDEIYNPKFGTGNRVSIAISN